MPQYKQLYLINASDTNLYKIGITGKQIKERIKELQTGNGKKLILIESFLTKHNYKFETAIQNEFITKKVKDAGDEWFELNEDDINSFKDICNKKEATMDFLVESNYFWQ